MKDNIAENFTRQVKSGLTQLLKFVVQKPVHALVLIALVLVIAIVIRMAIWANDYPDWVGFGKYNESTKGVRAKTLWDWMELLFIPVTLAVGVYFLNRLQTNRELKITLDNQRQGILEDYFDNMSELLLIHNLQGSEDDRPRIIARSRTLSLFRRIDGDRKGNALQFLYESDLILDGNGIVLLGADLSNAQLEGASLNSARLSGTDCSYANLQNANLIEAELNGINLSGANLKGCNFGRAKLRGAVFRGSNLHQAIFDGADLSDADFSDAEVDLNALRRAKSLKFATMKDGRIYESNSQ